MENRSKEEILQEMKAIIEQLQEKNKTTTDQITSLHTTFNRTLKFTRDQRDAAYDMVVQKCVVIEQLIDVEKAFRDEILSLQEIIKKQADEIQELKSN